MSEGIDSGADEASGQPAPAMLTLDRFEGRRAEVAYWSAQLLDATAAGDDAREREACTTLCRLFTDRGTDLDQAVTLARRALALGDDPKLRVELAGWLAGLGDPGAAGAQLVAAPEGEGRLRTRTLVQAGVLLARARRAEEAADVLQRAAELDRGDPLPLELLATLANWAEHAIGREDAARVYLEAARRRGLLGDEEAALEDLLRAVEIHPTSEEATIAVVGALDARGRGAAADEVLRDLAQTLDLGDKPRALEVHRKRLTRAIERGDAEVALAAALDIGLGGEADADLEAIVDDVLGRAGLHEVVAARLRRRAARRSGPPRAALLASLASLCGGVLDDARGAAQALIGAAAADPTQHASLDALRAAAPTERSTLIEALVQVVVGGRPGEATSVIRANVALELAQLAEDESDDPVLGDWALERAGALDPTRAEESALARARIEPRLIERDDAISRQEQLLEGELDSKEERIAALRKLVALYGRAPAFEERRFAALASVCRAEPEDEEAFAALEICFARAPSEPTRIDLLESVLRARLAAPLAARARREALIALVELLEPRGARIALEEASPLLEDDAGPAGVAQFLVLASAVGAGKDEGRALSLLASKLGRGLAAVTRASAAEAFRRAGALTEAKREAEAALDLDPGCVRAAGALAAAASVAGGRDAAACIERALGSIVPRAWLCDALARSLEAIGEQDLAFAWNQRWLALAPGDRRAIMELLRRCQQCSDPRRLTDALNWVLAQPDPPEERGELFFEALSLLFGFDRNRAGQVARRALDVYGPLLPVARERLAALADEHEDAGLVIALLERHVAADAEAPTDVLLELAHRRLAVGDVDGAARELLRAAQRSVDADRVLETLVEIEKDAGGALGSDGLLALAEAKARSLRRLLADPYGPRTDALTRKTVDAYRALGALRWDLAHDPRGAEWALFEAAELDPELGVETYAHDLAELAGPEKAARALLERLEGVAPERAELRVSLALAAAHIAAENGHPALTLDASLRVLELHPAHPEAIALVESSASQVEGGARAIDRVYGALAEAAMGVFGRRAAHYRAARQIERLGDKPLALKHALAAFEAVPTEGTSWGVLTRLVDPETGSAEAVALFLQLARRGTTDERTQWYRRALELAGSDRDGLSRRFDIALTALGAVPDVAFVGALRDAIAGLRALRALPSDAADRALAVSGPLVSKVEGPDGARLAALSGRVLAQLGAYEPALAAIRKAVEIDGELEVFDKLHDVTPLLADAPSAAESFVTHVLALLGNRHALVGPPLLRFASALADSLGDSARSADLLEEAERREAGEREDARPAAPEDDPFADPSMLDSEPPPRPSRTSVAPPAPSPPAPSPPAPPPSAPPPSAPAVRAPSAPAPTLESPRPPPTSVFEEHGLAPRSLGAARSRRASSTPEFRVVRDGFDALELEDQLASSVAPAEPLVAAPPQSEAAPTEPEPAPSYALPASEPAPTEPEPAPPSPRAVTDEAPSAPPRSQVPPTKDDTVAAARRALDAGDPTTALATLDTLPSADAGDPDVGRLRVAIHRASGDVFSLVVAIDGLVGALPETEAATLLLEASRAAFAAGDEQGALIRARRAVKLTPDDPDAVLACVQLEYTTRGMGTPREAQAVLDTLASIRTELTSAQAELRTFLTAEALDVIQGGGAGLRELSTRHAEFGALPLIALGMAERLLRGRSFEAAAPLFAEALRGDLRGLRNTARVSLAAADAAIQAGLLDQARAFLEVCEKAPETRGQVERRRREVRAYDPDPEIARPVLEELVIESSGLTKARFLQRLARITAPRDFEIAVALYEEALGLARRDRPMSDKIRAELLELIESKGISKNETIPAPKSEDPPAALPSDPPPSNAPSSNNRPDSGARPPLLPPSVPPSRPQLVIEAEPLPEEPVAALPEAAAEAPPTSAPTLALEEEAVDDELAAAVDGDGEADADETDPAPEAVEPPPDEPAAMEDVAPSTPPAAEEPPSPVSSSRRRYEVPERQLPAGRPLLLTRAEEALFADLLKGYADAGDALIAGFGSAPGRTPDVLAVRRVQATLRPGHVPTLEALCEAARAERDDASVRAVEHVLSVESGAPSVAPPLFVQPREPQLLAGLLTRDVIELPELAVLGILWEAGMYRRELASYALSGADRVPLAAGSVVGETYSTLANHLGLPRVVFQRRSEAPLEVGVALLAQPALIVSGHVRAPSPELAYRLAVAHASTTPQLILAAHLDGAALKRLFEAVMAAFGPVRPRDDDAPASSTDAFRADVARIAAELWQRVNPASERRLRELTESSTLDVQRARRAAGMASRRAGLFATGDLAFTLRILAEAAGAEPRTWLSPGGLDRAVTESTEAADAIRWSLRAELAEMRWQLPPPSSIRR